MAGRVAEHETIDALGGMGGEPQALHPAHGQPAPVEPGEPETIGNRQSIASEPLHGVGASREAGFAVTAPIVTHQAETLYKGGRKHVPHVQVGAERVRQNENRRPFRACDLDPYRTAICIDHWHPGHPVLAKVRPRTHAKAANEFESLGRYRARNQKRFSGAR